MKKLKVNLFKAHIRDKTGFDSKKYRLKMRLASAKGKVKQLQKRIFELDIESKVLEEMHLDGVKKKTPIFTTPWRRQP